MLISNASLYSEPRKRNRNPQIWHQWWIISRWRLHFFRLWIQTPCSKNAFESTFSNFLKHAFARPPTFGNLSSRRASPVWRGGPSRARSKVFRFWLNRPIMFIQNMIKPNPKSYYYLPSVWRPSYWCPPTSYSAPILHHAPGWLSEMRKKSLIFSE